jgi:hypothetical protein
MKKNPIKPSSPVCSTRKLGENPKLFIKGHALSLYFPSSIINMKETPDNYMFGCKLRYN